MTKLFNFVSWKQIVWSVLEILMEFFSFFYSFLSFFFFVFCFLFFFHIFCWYFVLKTNQYEIESVEKFLLNLKNFCFIQVFVCWTKNTHSHMYTHTHTHTYIYIYTCVYVCVCVYIYKYRLIGLVGRVTRQSSERPGFNPRSRHTKDFKNRTWYRLS